MVLGSTALIRSGLISLQMAVSAVQTAGRRKRQGVWGGTLLPCSSQGGSAGVLAQQASAQHMTLWPEASLRSCRVMGSVCREHAR